ncbi:metastasis-associated protein MTA2 [Coregonus clupeaformis]|uniref:metastasis-associated protein MTA2 n=1 Tax=Coregonus clupeaformis TaxID=59861 RepID=UPI001BE02054|nr:metastasis-associated protein MTA2 [Coregonus clupeaformis]XP_041723581.1 metastasis-associated protein MTA2 [Coregonus clupeaformis]
MADREERRFAEVPRESVKLMAESAEVELSDDVAALLVEDVCYRHREATQSQAVGLPFPTNGRPFTSGMRTTSQSVIKRQKVNQGDAPNPVVFVVTKDTRALRKHLTQSEMQRAARKPHLPVRVKLPLGPRPLVLPIMPSSTSEPIVLED